MIMGKDLGLAAIRIATGLIVAGHGYTKIAGGADAEVPEEMTDLYGPGFEAEVKNLGMENFTGYVESLGFPAADKMAYVAALSETVGGVALILGAGSKLASAAVLGTMVGAAQAHKGKGLIGEGGGETAFLVGAGALAIFLAGPGRLSVDGIMDGNF